MNKTEIKQKIITFGSFENLSSVCEFFQCKINKKKFVKQNEFKIDEYFYNNMLEEFNDDKNFGNEYAICESIIRPILAKVSKKSNLPFWSHYKFEVSMCPEFKLAGEPDYIFAIPTVEGGTNFGETLVCLAEAKKDNFIKGWGQVGAEMIAAQKRNKNKEIIVYGLVSTGTSWQFGKLEENVFTIDPNTVAAPIDLNKVCNSLSWLFCEARKNADKLTEIAKQKKENE